MSFLLLSGKVVTIARLAWKGHHPNYQGSLPMYDIRFNSGRKSGGEIVVPSTVFYRPEMIGVLPEIPVEYQSSCSGTSTHSKCPSAFGVNMRSKRAKEHVVRIFRRAKPLNTVHVHRGPTTSVRYPLQLRIEVRRRDSGAVNCILSTGDDRGP